MEAVPSTYLKFFACKRREKERVVLCSREIAHGRQETGFLGYQRHLRHGLSLAFSFQNKYTRPISAASSAQANAGSEATREVRSDKPNTVRVRFTLQKECAFGHQFVIVGDDPALGSWDPSNAVPLTWSDGHVWTAEMDLPRGNMIKYKFILRGGAGPALWQPGHNRILKTWYTRKTISVSEDWDNPELQSVVEEELAADLNKKSLVSNERADAIKEPVNANGHANHEKKLSEPMVAANNTQELGKQDLGPGDKRLGVGIPTGPKMEDMASEYDGREVTVRNFTGSEDEIRVASDEGLPVLVPGFDKMPSNGIEEAELNMVENNNFANIGNGYGEFEDSTDSKDREVAHSA